MSGRAAADASGATSYGDGPAFWDERYKALAAAACAPREWLVRWKDVAEIFGRIAEGSGRSPATACRVLNAGCGNSLLHEEMHAAGYTDVTSIDNSDVVIEQMKSRPEGQGLRYMCMDATQMEFADGSFDVVVDKCLLDCCLCGERQKLVVAMYLKEVVRVLRPDGVFFVVCLDHGRQTHLEAAPWRFRVTETAKLSSSVAVTICICRRTEESEAMLARWPEVYSALRRGIEDEDVEVADAEGQWRGVDDNVGVGDVVRVETEFFSADSSAQPVALRSGLRGIVKMIDDDGDAIIRFPRLDDASDSPDRFVLWDQFRNLKVRRPVDEASSGDSCRSTRCSSGNGGGDVRVSDDGEREDGALLSRSDAAAATPAAGDADASGSVG